MDGIKEWNKPIKTKEDLEEYKLYLVSKLKRSTYPEYPIGGQSCGMPRGVKLVCDTSGFQICIEERSQLYSYDIAVILYKLYLDETLK